MNTAEHAHRFTFLPPKHEGQQVRLRYRLDNLELEECIDFPDAPDLILQEQEQAFQRALEWLTLTAGISYYKAGLAREIEIQGLQVHQDTAELLRELYQQGLGELLWNAGLDHFRMPAFPVTQQRYRKPADYPLNRRHLLAMGGGKDSLLSAHLLQQAGEPVTAAFVGHSSLIAHTIQIAGLLRLQIQRRLDPRLALLNDQGAFNGHVPITAINSAILLLAAVWYNYDAVVFSNEHSANEGNFINPAGQEVNHQYSKSLAFEAALARHVHRHIHPGLEYFSLLRPWNEVRILEQFSRLEHFHPHFSSCNRNFHLEGSRNAESLWCGQCPKCHFTFLGLACFLPPARLAPIFGRNLLDDASQLQGFAALAGLDEHKPLECVGTVEESRAMMAHLQQQPAWRQAAVLQALQGRPELASTTPLAELLQRSHPHRLPEWLPKALVDQLTGPA